MLCDERIPSPSRPTRGSAAAVIEELLGNSCLVLMLRGNVAAVHLPGVGTGTEFVKHLIIVGEAFEHERREIRDDRLTVLGDPRDLEVPRESRAPSTPTSSSQFLTTLRVGRSSSRYTKTRKYRPTVGLSTASPTARTTCSGRVVRVARGTPRQTSVRSNSVRSGPAPRAGSPSHCQTPRGPRRAGSRTPAADRLQRVRVRAPRKGADGGSRSP